jgi:hypothetical protein
MKLSFQPSDRLCSKQSHLFIHEWLQDRTLIPKEIGFVVFMNYSKMPIDVGLARRLLILPIRKN